MPDADATPDSTSFPDVTEDHSPIDAPPESAPSCPGPGSQPCTQGILTQYPLAICGGDTVDWFATPYTATADISVERVEAHMSRGDVALLASAGGAPGAVLFQGSIGSSPQPTWLGADVIPPVALTGGTLYFVAFRGDCSFVVANVNPVEYIASSITGPWHVDGTDNWTARLIGTCCSGE